jgi:hypothetical protein
MAGVRKQRIDVILCVKLDRLGRKAMSLSFGSRILTAAQLILKPERKVTDDPVARKLVTVESVEWASCQGCLAISLAECARQWL